MTDFKETSVVKCKKCGVVKIRYLAGNYPTAKKWVDENNKMWNGKTCPPCNKERAKGTMRESRAKK